MRLYYEWHDRGGEGTGLKSFVCPSSLQMTSPEAMSDHHGHMALCPDCKGIAFVAPYKEVLETLATELRWAKRQVVQATEAYELFRQRYGALEGEE